MPARVVKNMKTSFLRICAVWRRFRRGTLRHHIHHARYLPQIESLMRRADPRAPWHARANWMIDLADWIRREPKVSLLDADEWRRIKLQRIRFLLDWLDANRDVRQNVQATVQKTLREATGHELFSSTGLARESGFFAELSERMVRMILPRSVGQGDLSTLFTAMFPDQSDADWLLGMDQKTLSRLWKLCADDGIAHSYQKQIDEALLYLVTMVISVGVSPAFRQRLESRMPLMGTPFMSLRRELESFLLSPTFDPAALRSVRMLIAVCQAQTDKIYAHLDEYGVSVGLVYHVERMRAQLVRIGRLLDLRTAPHIENTSVQVQTVLVDLIAAHHRRASIRNLAGRSFSLLARKMVERNTDHGEYYIARDRLEYNRMLRAGLRGGLVLAFTALVTTAIVKLNFANFFEGLLLSLNYALSFLAITALGGVLAARQAVVTAPTLAAEMGALDTVEGLRKLVAKIVAVLRVQIAGVFGNVLMVIPTIVAIAAALLLLAGRPLMNEVQAELTIHSLSLIGFTPLFAALTGVLLWLASLLAGFADNWFALRRLKESIAHHRRIVHALGPQRAERWAGWLERNIARIAGNLALALLLGMTPTIALFFGLPLDIRHITLSTAHLVAAASALGWSVFTEPQFWLAVAGLLVVGILNIAIAFCCALVLALRARDVPQRACKLVFRSVARRFTFSPHLFFWPPESARPAGERNAVSRAAQEVQETAAPAASAAASATAQQPDTCTVDADASVDSSADSNTTAPPK
jgi:site-specific recombinase